MKVLFLSLVVIQLGLDQQVMLTEIDLLRMMILLLLLVVVGMYVMEIYGMI